MKFLRRIFIFGTIATLSFVLWAGLEGKPNNTDVKKYYLDYVLKTTNDTVHVLCTAKCLSDRSYNGFTEIVVVEDKMEHAILKTGEPVEVLHLDTFPKYPSATVVLLH